MGLSVLIWLIRIVLIMSQTQRPDQAKFGSSRKGSQSVVSKQDDVEDSGRCCADRHRPTFAETMHKV